MWELVGGPPSLALGEVLLLSEQVEEVRGQGQGQMRVRGLGELLFVLGLEEVNS